MTEQTIENEIQAKGLTAPRVTPDQIDAMMARVIYRHAGFMGTTSMVVAAFLDGEFYLGCGHSACVSKANFDPEIGFTIAKASAEKVARDKLWELEGYLLREKLASQVTLNGHIQAPECHPMRNADADIDMLRSALSGLIGVDTEDELRQMETTMRLLAAPEADKAVSINAIHALLQTLPPADLRGATTQAN